MGFEERTISFAVWPHLITLEGPAATLATFIETLYSDALVARDQWSLANTAGVGRRAMAQRLRAHGKLVRRVGIAALTSPVSDEIERRVRSAGMKCFAMHLPTAGGASSPGIFGSV
jgi:hypothetical protein